MGTMKRRVTVTLTDRQHELLRVIGTGDKQPMSSLISEILELHLPVLERMAVISQATAAVRDAHRQRLAGELASAQEILEPAIYEILGQSDLFASETGEMCAHEVCARNDSIAFRKTSTNVEGPPPTNRGATTPRRKSGKPRQKGDSAVL